MGSSEWRFTVINLILKANVSPKINSLWKDQTITTIIFPCLQFEDQKLTILEAGCGVGNCLFPLLEEDLNMFAYACDFSPRAVEYVKVSKIFVIFFLPLSEYMHLKDKCL